MRKYYVYAHLTKLQRDKGNVFYIGKGFGKRAWDKNKRNAHWNLIVKKYGYEVKILIPDLTEDQAHSLEKNLIFVYGRHSLCNMTDGGEGSSGIVVTDEWRKKLSDSHRGKPRSPETIRKISETNRGRKCSDDARKNMSLSHVGEIRSDAHKAKISAALKGKPKSEEHKLNSGAGNRGKKRTIECRQAKSEAMKLLWLRPPKGDLMSASQQRRFSGSSQSSGAGCCDECEEPIEAGAIPFRANYRRIGPWGMVHNVRVPLCVDCAQLYRDSQELGIDI